MGIVYQEGPSLARDLGLPLRTLYAASNRIPAHYHRAEVPKRDGGVRVLRVPDPVLKDIQRRIARVLLSGMSVSPHATAYRYGAGVVENTRRYVGRPELLGQVDFWLQAQPDSQEAAEYRHWLLAEMRDGR